MNLSKDRLNELALEAALSTRTHAAVSSAFISEFAHALIKRIEQEAEVIAYYDCQERGFYWAHPTSIDAPITVKVAPIPLISLPLVEGD